MKNSRARFALAMAGTALVLSATLSGCSAITDLLSSGTGDAGRDDETGQVTESANVDIFSLKVGDCKMEDPSGTLSDTDVVPCDQPHDEEVYFEITMDDGDFSDDDVDTASEQCFGGAFTSFVGLAYDASVLEVFSITPTKETWDELNDRVVQCVIADPDGPTMGTLKGAAR